MWKIETISLVYTISFLDLLAVGLTLPLFGTYLRDLGVSHTIIGLIGSIYSGLQVLSGPLIGSWSDVRDRKSVLKSTIFICAICYGLLGTTSSVAVIFLLRFILGTVKHTQSICKAVITDLVPLKEQSEIFGKSTALASMGFIIGPFIGGNLSELDNGFYYVCELTAILFILNYGCACFLPEGSTPKKNHNPDRSISEKVTQEFYKTVKELSDIDWGEHWDTFLLKFLTGLTMTCYFSNQAVYLKEKYNLSPKHIGYMISFFSIIGMVSGFFFNKINKLYKDDESCFKRFCHAFIMVSLCFVGIYLSPNIWGLLVLIVPVAFSSTALRIVSMELMLKKSEKVHSGSLLGASNSIMSIARFVTPLITGFTSDIFNEESVMLVAVIPASLGLGVSFYMKRKYESSVKNK